MKSKFWAADVAAAAKAVQAAFPQNVALSLANAQEICQNRFVFRGHWEMERTNVPVQFGQTIDWAHIPANDPEWLYAMNRHTSFVELGKAWRATGDAVYAEKFAAMIDDWMARVPLDATTNNTTWRSLEAGLRCETWLRALQLFENSPVLTGERMARIEACLRIHGEYLATDTRRETFNKLSNWGVLQDHGLYLLGLYFGRADWCQLAARRLDDNLHRSVFRDGSHWEQSPMYHCEVLHCAMDTVLIARQNSQVLPARFVHHVFQMCVALAAWVTPEGWLFCQSDSDRMDARDLLAEGALLFDDGRLRAMAGDTLLEENLWDLGPAAQKPYAALAPDRTVFASAVLPDSGNVMLRAENPGRAWVHMHCGSMGSGHGHADLLHLDAGVGGELVLIDPGRYTYTETALRKALKQPAAHNTTRVDGLDFTQYADTWGYAALADPIKGEHTFTPTADYATGLHLGYLDAGVVTARRLVFLKALGVLLIFDEFFGKGTHTYEQNFHFGPGALTQNGRTLHWRGQKAHAALCCLGDGLTITPRQSPYSMEYNDLAQGDAVQVLRGGQDFGWFITALSLDAAGETPFAATLLPVCPLGGASALPVQSAQAVRVEKGGKFATVVLCHQDVNQQIEVNGPEHCEGYGRTLVFDEQNPDGLALSW